MVRCSGLMWAQHSLQMAGEGVLVGTGTAEGIHPSMVDVCGLNSKVNHEGEVATGRHSAKKKGQGNRDQRNKTTSGQEEEK